VTERADYAALRHAPVKDDAEVVWVAIGHWTFTDEIRNLCWEAVADDQQGTRIRRVGDAGEPDALLQQVKDEAAEITSRRREAAG